MNRNFPSFVTKSAEAASFVRKSFHWFFSTSVSQEIPLCVGGKRSIGEDGLTKEPRLLLIVRLGPNSINLARKEWAGSDEGIQRIVFVWASHA